MKFVLEIDLMTIDCVKYSDVVAILKRLQFASHRTPALGDHKVILDEADKPIAKWGVVDG